MLGKMLLPKYSKNSESGQVLVIILLVMVVGLTSGLFLLSRTTTDVTTSANIVDSTRAFNAAEAGIEEAIRSSAVSNSPVPLGSGLAYQVTVQGLGSGSDMYPSTKNTIKTGEVFTVWLVPHDESNVLVEDKDLSYSANFMDICYSDVTSGNPISAVGLTLYYKNGANYETSFVGFDSDATRRSSENNFLATAGLGNCGGANGYEYRANLRLGNNSDFGIDLTSANIIPLALRIQPYYNSASIAVAPAGGSALPQQGNQITSTGTSGETTRKIEVSESFTQPAPFLDTALYSFGANALSK